MSWSSVRRLVPELGPRAVVADGAGGFYVGYSIFSQAYYPFDSAYYAQRFRLDGTRWPGWPEAGVAVCQGEPDTRDGLVAAPDGLGGVLFAWHDSRGPGASVIHVARLLADGSLAPGWTTNGVPVSETYGGRASFRISSPTGPAGPMCAGNGMSLAPTIITTAISST